jgi:hypothetical protein
LKRLIDVSITSKIKNQTLSLLQKVNSLHVLDSPKIRVRGTANYKIDFSSGIAQLESIDAQELEIEEM